MTEGNIHGCALPYDLWCVVNNVGISSIKIDKLRQGCKTGRPELVTAPFARFAPLPWMPFLRDSLPLPRKAACTLVCKEFFLLRSVNDIFYFLLVMPVDGRDGSWSTEALPYQQFDIGSRSAPGRQPRRADVGVPRRADVTLLIGPTSDRRQADVDVGPTSVR